MLKSLTLAAIPLLALPCSAAISIEVQVGTFLDSSSAVVSDTSLWAIVYDEGGAGLPGGLANNTSLTLANTSQLFSDFAGATIATGGTIGTGEILWAGAVNGVATSGVEGVSIHELSNFTFAGLGVAAGGTWAIYWFPELTAASNTLSSSGFQVGGIQEVSAGSGGNIGMVFPVDDTGPANYTASFLDTSPALGGDIAISRFTAVTVVPEPSSVGLAMIGMAALLRRRRR